MLDSKLYQVEHHCCKFTSSWLHRVLCVGCQITKEDLWRKWPYEKQEVGSYLRFSFFWIWLPTNVVCFVSLPHPRLHTQHCYSVQASCSWNKVKQNALKKKKVRILYPFIRAADCTHLFSLWPFLWKHPRLKEWQMETAKHKNATTAPNTLRKIPRMSTSSATGHREVLLRELRGLRHIDSL